MDPPPLAQEEVWALADEIRSRYWPENTFPVDTEAIVEFRLHLGIEPCHPLLSQTYYCGISPSMNSVRGSGKRSSVISSCSRDREMLSDSYKRHLTQEREREREREDKLRIG